MRYRLLRLSVMALLVTVLLGTQVLPAMADAEEVWYLGEGDASGFSYPAGHVYDKTLQRPIHDGSECTLTLSRGESAWWYSGAAAQNPASFPAENWNLKYWAQVVGDEGGHRVYARLYVVDRDGNPVEKASKYSNLAPTDDPVQKAITFDAGAIDIVSGERLAVAIEWSGSADDGDSLTLHYNSDDFPSHLATPGCMPAWPTPDLPSLTLLSLGVLMLGGYAWLRVRGRSSCCPQLTHTC